MQYFRLFANCIPVKGAKRSIICDLQLGRYRFIPNELYTVLIQAEKMSLKELRQQYDSDSKKEIDKYFDLFNTDNWGFFTDNPELFPNIKPLWESPSTITNAILDFDANSNYNWKKALHELDRLLCEALQVRFFFPPHPEQVHSMLKAIDDTDIHYVELQTISLTARKKFYKDLLKKYKRLRKIVVSDFSKNDKIDLPHSGEILFTTKKIDSETHCGIVAPDYFRVNLPHFFESKKKNSCLNRKLSVDKNGYIKNCPSLIEHFGHIDNESILNVVKLKAFTKLGNVTKDQIDTCQDCEFRYICTDCRAYVSGKNEASISKPLKCSYDPYSATWSNTDV